MHNLQVLVKGKPRCTVHVHPDDAARLGFGDGADVRVSSTSGAIVLPAEVTDAVMPGVVSIPHGWGHGVEGTQMATAAPQRGRELERARAVRPLRPAFRQRRVQRDPGRARGGLAARPVDVGPRG